MPSKRLVARVCVLTGEIEAEEQRKELVAERFRLRRSSAKRQKFFLGKEKKLKHFSFSIKRNLYSSCSRIYSSIVKT